MTPKPPHPELLDTPASPHHESDVMRGQWVLWTVSGLAVAIVGSLLALAVSLRLVTRATRPGIDEAKSIIAGEVPRSTAPRLQPSQQHDRKPADDLHAMRAAENDVFQRMGWHVDAATGRAGVPANVVAHLRETANRRQASTSRPVRSATTRRHTP